MAGDALTVPRLGPYPVLLPRLRDPRLAQSAVLLTLQVLGQTVLGFPVSIPQIATSLGTCALIEVLITFARHRILLWPASALLTGNGVALLLRDPATRVGDHWSTQALGLFAGVAAVSVVSKHVIRFEGSHVFNPSNIGLVATLVVLGPERADVQFLYWGPWRPGLAAAIVLIVVGAVFVGRRAGVVEVAVVYLVALAAGLGMLAATGHCIVALWHAAPLCGAAFWWRVAASPETLVFAAFMVTDPRTVPRARTARLAFAGISAGAAVLFAAPGHSEFATKVALLGGLAAASTLLFGARVAARRSNAAALRAELTPLPNPMPLLGSEADHDAVAAVSAPQHAVRSPRRAALVAASLATVGVWAVAVHAAASLDDGPLAGAGRATSASSAFEPHLPAWPEGVEPPAVSTAPDVADWSPWFRPVDADIRARALVVDLERARLEVGGAPVTYVRVEVLMVRVPANRQNAPEIGVAATTLDTAGIEHVAWYRLESRDETFVIAGPAEPWSS